MKIAYMFYDRPDYCAGPRINALRLLPEFIRRGHEVTAFVLYGKACPARPLLERQGVRVRALPWQPFVEDHVKWIYDCLAAEDPDVFVPNIFVSGCYAARFVREAGRPTIAGHLSNDEFNWGMAERFCKAGDAWAVSGLFCMGEELARVVRSWSPRRTTVVDIPHGVALPTSRARQDNPLRLIYAGRLEERQKRISDVVHSIASVLRRHPTAVAKIVGEGSRRAAVEEQIRTSGLAERLVLSGFVPPDQVQEEMLSGNILVLLSDFEGVPGAVMDGMACGLIPVCLDIDGGLRELVVHEKTGLLVADREQSFQAAIRRLGEDSGLRDRLAKNARIHIEEKFSLNVAADRWEQLFEILLADAGPRRPLRFPAKPLLPTPFSMLHREDRRRPSRLAALVTHFRKKGYRWARRSESWLAGRLGHNSVD